MSDSPALEFTGERFTPECVREIWYEHYHRYAFAARLAAGRRVLDAASGEGYGSALLSARAQSVIGVDIDVDSVEHARQRYAGCSGLAFRQGDVTALVDLPDKGLDLIVSFETLEHVEAQEAMLDGFARLLAPAGLLLVSTPDKRNYSDLPGFNNEHHVRELYRDQFESMLHARFAHTRIYAQKLVFQSLLWTPAEHDGWCADLHGAASTPEAGLPLPPMYYLAVCSQQPLPALPGLSMFSDSDESVYSHYQHEIRKNMAAGARIQQLEAELAEAQAAIARLQQGAESGNERL